jgi:hypothetical protein
VLGVSTLSDVEKLEEVAGLILKQVTCESDVQLVVVHQSYPITVEGVSSACPKLVPAIVTEV